MLAHQNGNEAEAVAVFRLRHGAARLDRLRARRLAEDERLVCLARAQILLEGQARHAGLGRVPRQAAVLADLCERIPIVIEPEDVLLGRMPESIPTPEDERFIAERPELFCEAGVPGWLDSLSIFIPDWDWLFEEGLGGIADAIEQRRETAVDASQREFLETCRAGLRAVSRLIHRHAAEARHLAAAEPAAWRRDELLDAADRCARVASDAPRGFVDALQLVQLVHMAMACLVGGRDVTPGRLDQTLLGLYRRDVESGALQRDDAVTLLAMAFLRMSQMGGAGTDWDDNERRSPCRYTHLYVTVGGVDADGSPALNELSFVVAEAIRRLRYKEPTLLVRYRADMDPGFKRAVADLVRDRFPVSIYCDEAVIEALQNNGVPLEQARSYAHSACHNVIVTGHEAGSGPGGFHNLPMLLLAAMETKPASFEELWAALRTEVQVLLADTRRRFERRWHDELAESCPLLPSSLMRHAVTGAAPCWQTADVSHFNHYLMGLATVVDSLLAVRRLVFDEGKPLDDLLAILQADWVGHEALRRRVWDEFPRHGQDSAEARELAQKLCRLWNDEVRRASHGMARLAMWPAFYSHRVHAHAGRNTPATPDGRRGGDALSENLSPSFGGPACSAAATLRAMAELPTDYAASGACSLTLNLADYRGVRGADNLIALLEAYFQLGGRHLHVSAVDVGLLEDAVAHPDNHAGLMVRVAGYSAYFTRLPPDIQQDIIARYRRDVTC